MREATHAEFSFHARSESCPQNECESCEYFLLNLTSTCGYGFTGLAVTVIAIMSCRGSAHGPLARGATATELLS